MRYEVYVATRIGMKNAAKYRDCRISRCLLFPPSLVRVTIIPIIANKLTTDRTLITDVKLSDIATIVNAGSRRIADSPARNL